MGISRSTNLSELEYQEVPSLPKLRVLNWSKPNPYLFEIGYNLKNQGTVTSYEGIYIKS